MNIQERLDRIETHLGLGAYASDAVRKQWEAIPQEEKDAGWWQLESTYWCGGFGPTTGPLWEGTCKYRVTKTEKHPDNDRHARVKLEWDKVKDKGTHELWFRHEASRWTRFYDDCPPSWSACEYEIRPVEKPQKRLIDKSKLPIGAMTNYGRLMQHTGDRRALFWRFEYSRDVSANYDYVRIVPMTEWEVLREGDVIPQGVLAETSAFARMVGCVYRITGIADGYTDNESEA